MTKRQLIWAALAALLASIAVGVVMFRAELSRIEARKQRQLEIIASRCSEAVKKTDTLIELADSAAATGEHCKAEELLTAALAHIESAGELCTNVADQFSGERSADSVRTARDEMRRLCGGAD